MKQLIDEVSGIKKFLGEKDTYINSLLRFINDSSLFNEILFLYNKKDYYNLLNDFSKMEMRADKLQLLALLDVCLEAEELIRRNQHEAFDNVFNRFCDIHNETISYLQHKLISRPDKANF